MSILALLSGAIGGDLQAATPRVAAVLSGYLVTRQDEQHASPPTPTRVHRPPRATLAGDPATAFAIAAGKIVDIGTADQVTARHPGAPPTDFGDAVVMPGLNDAHTHLGTGSEGLLAVDLSAATTATLQQLKDKLRTEADAAPAESWVRGSNYDDAKLGTAITRWDLDDAAPEQPVLVLHIAGHWGVANSRALKLAGLDDRSPAPEGGQLGRDGSGRLNGMLFEQSLFELAYPAAVRAAPIVPPYGLEDRLRALGRLTERFNSVGLTSVCDALVGPEDLALFDEAGRRGMLSLRVNYLLAAEHYGTPEPTGDAQRLRITGVKSFVDGAVGGRTCLLEEPFEGSEDDFGIQSRSAQELRDIIRTANGDGHRVGIHANGDRAIRLLLALYEEQPRPDLRNRIEHCTVVDGEILRRMRDLELIATPFGSYVDYHGGRLLEWYGEKRASRMFAHRSFLDAGVSVAGSSDYPCGPFSPFLAMQSCVTRLGSDGVPVGVNQRISRREALELYTTGSAAATGEEHLKGRLAPGYLADFVVLEADPLTTEPMRLSALGVRQTFLGGDQVWPAPT